MSPPDFYSILNVPRSTTSITDLRKAYRLAALRYHPDKNRGDALAEARFKEVTVAFQTLSDPERRAAYDLRCCAEYGLQQENIWDFEEEIVDGYDAFEDFAARNAFVRQMEGENGTDLDAEVMFASLFGKRSGQRRESRGRSFVAGLAEGQTDENGQGVGIVKGDLKRGGKVVNGEKRRSIGRGNGKEDGSERRKTPDRVIELPLTLGELFHGCKKHRKIIRKINGSTMVDAVKKGSADAAGNANSNEKSLTIIVQPGYRPGDRIRFHNVGDEETDMIVGDVVFKITQKKHPHFVRYSDNLRRKVLISVSDALTGLSTTIEGIDGSKIPIVCKDVLTPGTTKVLKGQGMPRRGKPTERGDLTLEFAIFYPTKLTTDEKVKIRDCLNEPSARWENTFLPGRKDALCYVSAQKKSILSSHRKSKRVSRRAAATTMPIKTTSPEQLKKATSTQSGLGSNKRKIKLSPSRRIIEFFR